jgi:hypothetical protein
MGHCYYCGPTDRDLRPYGPGGSTVCLPCATATPDREAATAAAYRTLLEAADVMSPDGLIVVGQASGPQPATTEEVLAAIEAAEPVPADREQDDTNTGRD